MTQDEINNILKTARQLGYSVEPIGDGVFRITWPDADWDDVSIEKLQEIVDEPPIGWVEEHFGTYPPLKTNQYGTGTIALEDGGFDWAAFDKFTDWMIQQEERVVDAPQYYTGDNAWEEAAAAARAATEASGGKQEWEVVGVPGPEEAYYIQPVEAEEAREGWLGTEEVGDWIYEVYGYTDATGEHITRKEPRATKDPRQSLDNLIALALGEVDDWSDPSDLNLQKAQALFDFKNQPTDAERLRMAMDIAQSPSDYMTLVAMYTGAISRESGPARVGEKVAPLMPYLQQMAQKFFLDIPGINEMPAPGAEAAETIDGEAATMADGADVGALGATPQKTLEELREEYRQQYGEVELTDEPLEHWEVGPSPITAPTATDGYAAALQTAELDKIDDVQGQALEYWEFPGGPEAFRAQEEELYGGPRYDVDYEAAEKEAFRAQEEETYGGQGFTTPDLVSPYFRKQFRDKEEKKYGIESFQQGGIVPGKMGEPKLIRAHGGEIVIPNAVRSPYTESLFGPTFTPRRETLGRFLTRPAKVQIPSMIGGDFRFRSPQTIRRMTPLQRSLFQEGIKSFGVPWGDFRMQESLATGAGGSGRPRAQFRRPSFVRG